MGVVKKQRSIVMYYLILRRISIKTLFLVINKEKYTDLYTLTHIYVDKERKAEKERVGREREK